MMEDKDTTKVTYKIRERAYEIIESRPSGLRYSELVDAIHRENPEFNIGTIHKVIWDLRNHKDYKDKLDPTPRIYKLKSSLENPEPTNETFEMKKAGSGKHDEEEFYDQFAKFLRYDLDECNLSKPVGKSKLFRKWETPDVFGYQKIKTTSSFQKHPELVAGELKVETKYDELITAFGQAASYLLFCHKSYVAVPDDSDADGLARLEALCINFGIGLLLFNRNDPQAPEFKIRNRSQRHEPNFVYLNEVGVKLVNFIESDD